MRRIVVDWWISPGRKNYLKRGGGDCAITLIEDQISGRHAKPAWSAVDGALNALAELDKRKAKVVRFRFFGDLTAAETAEVLSESVGAEQIEVVLEREMVLFALGNLLRPAFFRGGVGGWPGCRNLA
jgi:DNA-directed RNA polymerase specialized sigma24 family protein